MPLPSSMEARREQLKNGVVPAATPSSEVSQEEVQNTPEQSAPNNNEEGRITITKKEFNELQAAKDRLTAAERRADAVRDDLEALQARLTELEQGSKGVSEPSPSAAPARPASLSVDATQIPLTDKEKEDFEEDTIALMQKIATNVARSVMAEVLPKIEAKLGEIETTASNAAKTAGQTGTNAFTERVRAKVAEFSDFDTIVTHPHWQDFVISYNDLTGEQYGSLIQKHVREQKPTGVTSVANIFRTFYDKYIKDSPNTDGYAGVVPSGNVEANTEGSRPAVETLKFSDRKKLHNDYLAKRIDYEKYISEKEKFDQAEREGRIDYQH